MVFNPFEGIYDYDGKLAPTFEKKMDDTFWVVCGDAGDFYTHFGIFDYITLGVFTLPTLFFFGLAMLSFSVISVIEIAPLIGYALLPLTIPVFLVSIVALTLLLVIRASVSGLITGLVSPVVALVHIISKELNFQEIKESITSEVNKAVANKQNSVTMDFDEFVDEELKNHLVDTLNNHPIIREIKLTKYNLDIDFIKNLHYIERLSVPKHHFDEGAYQLVLQSNVNHLEMCCSETLDVIEFLTKNTKVDNIILYDAPYLEEGMTPVLKEAMQSEGIAYPCAMQFINSKVNQTNPIMQDISRAFCTLEVCFTYFKISNTADASRDDYLICDVRNYIIGLLMQLCPNDIVEQNKKGFAKAIQSGFFSKPALGIQKTAEAEQAPVDASSII